MNGELREVWGCELSRLLEQCLPWEGSDCSRLHSEFCFHYVWLSPCRRNLTIADRQDRQMPAARSAHVTVWQSVVWENQLAGQVVARTGGARSSSCII